MKKFLLNLYLWVLYLTGYVLICVGVGMIYLPAGLIVSGIFMAAHMILWVMGKLQLKKEEEEKLK